ncbi:MAG TPA: hypothetical protein DCL54_10520 [Alphaproteobacteria bacterium]|nr:hypothetical protein [Alphaproteobacteria bacterium]HAJ47001.1 hypothetical protein [Alphaproteobacteria bacterium]
MSRSSGKRNLALIRSSGSTSRILNLLVAHERFGETAGYNKWPLFKSRRLNRAILIKHTLRGGEADNFEKRRSTATKVIFPFAASDLSLGGTYFFAEQRNIENVMRDFVGDEVTLAEMDSDRRTLKTLDDLPSLDPFLMREGLRRQGIEPALCYFDISEADIRRMTDYVSREIATLVQLAFGGGAHSAQMAEMMAAKLLSDENTESLLPLRETLQLSGEQYSEGIFAWKGFLYYKWVYSDAQLRIARTIRDITQIKFAHADRRTEAHLVTSRERIIKHIAGLQGFVREALNTYDRSFRDLTEKARPMAFREFLLNSPAMFLELGNKLGSIMHVITYWRFKFPDAALLRIEAEDALDLFQEFENSLETGGTAARSQVSW